MTRRWRDGRRGTGLGFSSLPAELDPLLLLKLQTDLLDEEVQAQGHDPDREAVDPDLRLVAPADEQVHAVGGADEEDEEHPGAERSAERRPPRRIARPIEQVVHTAIARDASFEPRPSEQDKQDDNR